MPIEDVFSISGRGTVVTGRIERGVVNVGDECRDRWHQGHDDDGCTGVEMFRKLLDRVKRATTLVACCAVRTAKDVERGQVLAQAGFDHSRTRSSRLKPTS